MDINFIFQLVNTILFIGFIVLLFVIVKKLFAHFTSTKNIEKELSEIKNILDEKSKFKSQI